MFKSLYSCGNVTGDGLNTLVSPHPILDSGGDDFLRFRVCNTKSTFALNVHVYIFGKGGKISFLNVSVEFITLINVSLQGYQQWICWE